MAESTPVWRKAFWSAIGRCSEADLRADVFDIFSLAVDEFKHTSVLRGTLESMSRYSVGASEKLAAILLWTIVLPGPMTWSIFERLKGLDASALTSLGSEIATNVALRQWSSRPPAIRFGILFEIASRYVGREVRGRIEGESKVLGRIERTISVDGGTLVRMMCNISPAYRPMLANGLVSADESIRLMCADRLRYIHDDAALMVPLLRPVVAVDNESVVGKQLASSLGFLERRASVRNRRR
jgi:hypothetical protein